MSQVTKRTRRTYPTAEQKAELIRLVEADVELRSGKYSATFTKEAAQLRWASIARKVNSLFGDKKSWLQWRKTWQDMRSKAKKRQAELRRRRLLHGRGFGPKDPLSYDAMLLRGVNDTSLGLNDSQDSVKDRKNTDITLDPESEAGSVPRSLSKNFPKQEMYSSAESEEEDFKDDSRNRIDVKKTNLTQSFLTALALNKEKNEFKKQFYNDYIAEMKRQTEALFQIANNIAKLSENNGNTNNITKEC